MSFWQKLERRYAVPEFGGWMLGMFALFFFLAATNTLAGWLYVLSGTCTAVLVVGAVSPGQILKGVRLQRETPPPVHVQEVLVLTTTITNPRRVPLPVLQVRDELPPALSDRPLETIVEGLGANTTQVWRYGVRPQRRGVYPLPPLSLISASPFGLFRSCRTQNAPAQVVVYPLVLPLTDCPLLRQLGEETERRVPVTDQTFGTAMEGLTKTLRPYRWGDSLRLVHWRTSARYGDLQVRELENPTGGQDLVLALDTAPGWPPAAFELAVVAIASWYDYAQKHDRPLPLWLPETGLLRSPRHVWEALAAVQPTMAADAMALPPLPVLWLGYQPVTGLPPNSRALLWPETFGGILAEMESQNPESPALEPGSPEFWATTGPKLQQALQTLA
ncbi:MAG: DUF58 domain-containing protein [Pseudanabaenaceae cyanobacterium]